MTRERRRNGPWAGAFAAGLLACATATAALAAEAGTAAANPVATSLSEAKAAAATTGAAIDSANAASKPGQPATLRVATTGDYAPFSMRGCLPGQDCEAAAAPTAAAGSAASVVPATGAAATPASTNAAAAPASPREGNAPAAAPANELSGFDVEVARRFAADRGYKVEFVAVRWPDLSASLAAGAFDVRPHLDQAVREIHHFGLARRVATKMQCRAPRAPAAGPPPPRDPPVVPQPSSSLGRATVARRCAARPRLQRELLSPR